MLKNIRPVYIVDGARTPFLKAQGKPNPLSASDLALGCAGPLLLRQPFSNEDIEEVVAGCVSPEPSEGNLGRLIALRLKCGDKTTGFTVQRYCGSGMQAIDNAVCDVAMGRYNLVLAGGAESMSRAPLLLSAEMVSWLADLRMSKDWTKKIKTILEFKPRYLKPYIALLAGLTDHTVNMSMGTTAEKLAYQFNITRQEMDEFALRSHTLAKEAKLKGYLNEIVPLFDYQGHVFDSDTGVRGNSSLEKLSQLPPAFDKPFGIVTAGNSSQVTDGAAFVILASEEAIKRFSLPVLGRIIHTNWAGLDPSVMGLGPVHAIAKLLQAVKLSINDIDYWEINEAFAAQLLACLKAMQDKSFCRDKLGLDNALGSINMDKLNVDGGAIAMGHPVGASGARIILHLLHVLKRNQAKRGIASLCIGGGQGGAMLLERVEE